MSTSLNAFISPEDMEGIKPLQQASPKEIRAIERNYVAMLELYMNGAGSFSKLMQDISKASNLDGAKMFNALVSAAKQILACCDPKVLINPVKLLKAAFNIVMTAASPDFHEDYFLNALQANLGKAKWQLDPLWMTTADKDDYALRQSIRDYDCDGIQLCSGGSEPSKAKQRQNVRVRRIPPPGCSE